MNVASVTDVGLRRDNNEDSVLVLPGAGLFAVADGLGGHRSGEVASGMVTAQLARFALENPDGLSGEELRSAVESANATVFAAGRDDPRYYKMGSTCLVGAVRQGRLSVAHVGDSRAHFARRDGEARRLTQDHRAVQDLVDQGQITETQATVHPMRNVITRGMGLKEDVLVDVAELDLVSGDRLLLSSDGLTDMVPEEEILELLGGREPVGTVLGELFRRALAAGGEDNVSIVIAQWDEADLAL